MASTLQERLVWLLEKPLLGLVKFESPNPPTLSTVKLGKLLFYEARLSKDGTISCASCHESKFAFSSQTALSQGIGGQLGKRKAPVIINRAFHANQFWDGRAESLEAQVTGPLTNPLEMGSTVEAAVAFLEGNSGYRALFSAAFGTDQITIERVSRSVADFEKTLLSGNSKWDLNQNDPASHPLTVREARGFEIFNDRECHICHQPPAFTDDLFHNSGVAFKNGVFVDEGRFGYTKTLGSEKAEELGAFKTPTLRNVNRHGPFMHDGSLKTLEEVVEFYNQGGVENPHLDPDITSLGLSDQDKQDLISFLGTLDGEGFDDVPPLPGDFPR